MESCSEAKKCLGPPEARRVAWLCRSLGSCVCFMLGCDYFKPRLSQLEVALRHLHHASLNCQPPGSLDEPWTTDSLLRPGWCLGVQTCPLQFHYLYLNSATCLVRPLNPDTPSYLPGRLCAILSFSEDSVPVIQGNIVKSVNGSS